MSNKALEQILLLYLTFDIRTNPTASFPSNSFRITKCSFNIILPPRKAKLEYYQCLILPKNAMPLDLLQTTASLCPVNTRSIPSRAKLYNTLLITWPQCQSPAAFSFLLTQHQSRLHTSVRLSHTRIYHNTLRASSQLLV